MRPSGLSRQKCKLNDSSRQSRSASQDLSSTHALSTAKSKQRNEVASTSDMGTNHLHSTATCSSLVKVAPAAETKSADQLPSDHRTSTPVMSSPSPSIRIAFQQRKAANEPQKISSALLVARPRRAGLSKPPSIASSVSPIQSTNVRSSKQPHSPIDKAAMDTSPHHLVQRQSNIPSSFRAEKPSTSQSKTPRHASPPLPSGKENAIPCLQQSALKSEPSQHVTSSSKQIVLPLPASPISPSFHTPLTIVPKPVASVHNPPSELPLKNPISPKVEGMVVAETPPQFDTEVSEVQLDTDVPEAIQQSKSNAEPPAACPPDVKQEIPISEFALPASCLNPAGMEIPLDTKPSKRSRKNKLKPLPLPPVEATETISFSQEFTPASIGASQKASTSQQELLSAVQILAACESSTILPIVSKLPGSIVADGSIDAAAIHSGIDVEEALQQMIDVEQQLEVLKDEPFASATVSRQLALPLFDSQQLAESIHEFLTPKSVSNCVERDTDCMMDVDHNAPRSAGSVIDKGETEYPPFKPPDLSNRVISTIKADANSTASKQDSALAVIQHSWPRLTDSGRSVSPTPVERKTPPRNVIRSVVASLFPEKMAVDAVESEPLRTEANSSVPIDSLLSTTVRDAFTRALGKDVKGCDLGPLMCEELQQLQSGHHRVPMVHYAAHIWKQLELQQALIKQLRNASVSIKELFEMYPQTEMPKPLPRWDQVVPTALPQADNPHAAPSIAHVSVANLPMNKRHSKGPSAKKKGSFDIRTFATSCGPTEAEKLASDSIIQARMNEQVRFEAATAAATLKAEMERQQAERLAANEAAHQAAFRPTKPAPLFQRHQPKAQKQAPVLQSSLKPAESVAAAAVPTIMHSLFNSILPQREPQADPQADNQSRIHPLQRPENDDAMVDIPISEAVVAIAGSDPPALERVPGALHLFSNPPDGDIDNDDANVVMDNESTTPKKPSPIKVEQQHQQHQHLLDYEAAPMVVSPAPHRSAASFLSPSTTRPATEAVIEANRSPPRSAATAHLTPMSAGRICTPMVTVSPLTGSSVPASSSSSDSRRTPPPAQRNPPSVAIDVPATNSKRAGTNSNELAAEWKSKRRSRGKEPNDDEARDESAVDTATARSITSRSFNAEYQKRKHRLNSRQSKVDAANMKQRPSGGWSHTNDGELVYTSKLDRNTYKGSEAKEMERRDSVAADQQRQLKRSFQQLETANEWNNREVERREQTVYAMSEDEVEEKSETLQLQEAEEHLEREMIASGHSLAAWLPVRLAESYQANGITKLYDWQIACLRSPGVLDGRSNIIYSASTSAGKTLVAEILLLRRILSAGADLSHISPDSNTAQSRKVLFVLPFVSIVDEKCRDLCLKLSSCGFIIKGYHGQMSSQLHASHQIAASRSLNTIESEIDVAVVIIEKANSLWENLREQNRLHEICAVIVDELHMISDNIQSFESSQSSTSTNARGGSKNRGYLLELLLTKVRQYNSKFVSHSQPTPVLPIQAIGMSATLPNMDLFKEWLSPCELYSTTFRPVPLKEFVLKVSQKEEKEVYEKVPNSNGAVTHSTAAAAAASSANSARKWRLEKVGTLKKSEMAQQAEIQSATMDEQSQKERQQQQSLGKSSTVVEPRDAEEKLKQLPYVIELIKQVVTDSNNPDRAAGSNADSMDAVGDGGGVLLFCGTKIDVEWYAIAIAKALNRQRKCRDSGVRVEVEKGGLRTSHGGSSSRSRQMTLDPHINVASREDPLETERWLLIHQIGSLAEPLGYEHEKAIRNGVGFHHAGLAAEVRILVEAAFRKNVLSVLCCTTTLAYGVNLPSKRVIFQSCKFYNGQTMSLLSLIQYQQMSGRAGRAGFNQKGEGSSFIIVQDAEFKSIEGLLNGDMPPLRSSLDHISGCEGLSSFPIDEVSEVMGVPNQLHKPKAQEMVQANRYLCHAILEAITSLQGVTKINPADIQLFLSNTLLAHQKALEERARQRRSHNHNAASSSTNSMRAEVISSLKYLQSKRLISESTNCSTMLGSALCETGLNPVDGVRLHEELKYIRENGLNLASHLQICWLLTPPEVPYQSGVNLQAMSIRWERMRHRWSRLSVQDKYVLDNLLDIKASNAPIFQRSVGEKYELIEMSSMEYHKEVRFRYSDLVTFQNLKVPELQPRHRAYFRAYEAMVLQDLLDETKLNAEIQRETNLPRGDLQYKLTQACQLCNQLTTLCERLGWRDLSLVLELYRDRFAHNGAPTELLQLLRIPSLKMTRARWLQQHGIDSIEKVSRAGVDRVLEIFRKEQPYHAAIANTSAAASSTSRHQQAKVNGEALLRQQQELKKKEESRQRAELDSARAVVLEATDILRRQKELKQRLYQL